VVLDWVNEMRRISSSKSGLHRIVVILLIAILASGISGLGYYMLTQPTTSAIIPEPAPTSIPTPTPAPTSIPTPSPKPSPTWMLGQIRAVNATASSFNGDTYGPLNAIDGVESTSSYWGTASILGLPQWLKIDLGFAANIDRVDTHFYDGSQRVYTYSMDVSADNVSWITVVPSKTGIGIVSDNFSQTTARYVRINVTNNTANTAAHIEEVRVFQAADILTPTLNINIVDSTNNNSYNSSLALNSAYNPKTSYYDATDGDSKYLLFS
jgi:hypothetical protein